VWLEQEQKRKAEQRRDLIYIRFAKKVVRIGPAVGLRRFVARSYVKGNLRLVLGWDVAVYIRQQTGETQGREK